MKNSRSLDDLVPPAAVRARKFLQAANDNGIDLLITSTLRDSEAQAALYAQGRTKPGKIVTNAKPGQSWHNWGCALDVVPLRNGKPVWGTTTDVDKALWDKVGQLGEQAGLEWAGRWRTFREFAHFQYTGGLKLADLQAGKKIA
jgi:peptidoglycan L-alanyl-D-glutamate endopeptidase CwlK